MKAILFACVLICWSQLRAQNDSLMPNLSANYSVGCTSSGAAYGEIYHFENLNTNFDTIEVTQVTQGGALIARIYMDSLRVYLKRLAPIQDCYVGWSDYNFSGEWELLYDFGLEIGDSTYGLYGSVGYITAIDEILIQGQTRKKFQIDNGVETYIQGIGSVKHPFLPLMYLFENSYVVCESSLQYIGPSPIDSLVFSPDCNGEILSTNDVDERSFTVHPNPSTGLFNIGIFSTAPVDRILIYDLLGNEVVSNDLERTSAGFSVNLLGKAPGIYLARIESAGRIYTQRLILLNE